MKKPIRTARGSVRDETPTPLKGDKLSPDSAVSTITKTLERSKVDSRGGGARAEVRFSRGHPLGCEQDPFFQGGLRDGKKYSASPSGPILSNHVLSCPPPHPRKQQGACVKRPKSQSSLSVLDRGSGAPKALSMSPWQVSVLPLSRVSSVSLSNIRT